VVEVNGGELERKRVDSVQESGVALSSRNIRSSTLTVHKTLPLERDVSEPFSQIALDGVSFSPKPILRVVLCLTSPFAVESSAHLSPLRHIIQPNLTIQDPLALISHPLDHLDLSPLDSRSRLFPPSPRALTCSDQIQVGRHGVRNAEISTLCKFERFFSARARGRLKSKDGREDGFNANDD
jgi:hypothetical protein